jgi:hypothetical protein
MVLSASAATNVFFGTVRYDACSRSYLLSWTNAPYAFVLESSLNLTSWYAMEIVSCPPERMGRRGWEWTVTNALEAQFYRLREVQPIPVPVR